MASYDQCHSRTDCESTKPNISSVFPLRSNVNLTVADVWSCAHTGEDHFFLTLRQGGVVLVDIDGKRRRYLTVLQALLSQSWSVLTAVTFGDYQTGWFLTADFKSLWDTLTLFFCRLSRGHALLCEISSYSLNHFHKYFTKLWSGGDASDKTLNNVLLHLSSPLQPHFLWTKLASWLRPFFETSNSSERCKSLTPYLTARPIGAQSLGCFASESRHRTLKVLSPTSNGDRWE